MATRKPVVVITGASKGIGLAVTGILLRTFNANVIAISRSRTAELAALHDAHKESLLTIECNVTDAAAFTDAIALGERTYAHIDGLILNAGVLEPLGKIASPEVPLDAWKTHFDVNFFSLITALRATLPALRRSELGGKVIFTSSGSAVGNTAGWGPYNASKAALNSLSRTLAQEEPGIVCVAVRPGKVDTAMQVQIREQGAGLMSDKDHQSFVDSYMKDELVKPEESGHVIAALSVKAPTTLSGQFVSWDSEDCREFWAA